MSRLVAFGETALWLSPPGHERLETADRFEVRAVGAESNTAVAAGRLGADVTWISKLPDTPLGRRIVGELEGLGVETDVVWSPEGRVAAAYHEHGAAPRASTVVYDRAGSSFTTATADELPLSSLRSADLFFSTGVTAAASPSIRSTLGSLLVTAKERNIRTAFSLNYRSSLWEPDVARETLVRYFPAVDVLITSADDARTVLDVDGPGKELAHHLATEWNFETVVVTLGEHGAIVWHDSSITEGEGVETDTVDPVGTGDAFVGAFLARRLAGDEVGEALSVAGVAAALVRTVPGNFSSFTRADVDAALGRESNR